MDREVSRTLAELEHKLHELERALASAGREEWGEHAIPHPGEQVAEVGAPASEQHRGARLVDEGLAPAGPPHAPAGPPHAPAGPPHAPAGPPPVPPQAPPAATDAPRFLQAAPNTEQTQASYGESIELAELVRFRDRLDRTLRELAEDYERIIRLGTPSSPSSPRSYER